MVFILPIGMGTVRFYVESLGCPKNLVDSQGIERKLRRLGHVAVTDPKKAQVLIVNTCGFIQDARDESLGELRNLARKKRGHQVLIAAGCLSQYWGDDLLTAVPGVDALLGTRRWHEIDRLVAELAPGGDAKGRATLAWLDDPAQESAEDPQTARQGASAYLRVADGCNAPCAFCAIPLIKGPARSRAADQILRDAANLVQEGVKELVLIAQDTTTYGLDRGEQDALPGLVQAILKAVPVGEVGHNGPGLHWLRLMYAYPGHISPRLIEVMASDPRVCHYVDLPLQHAHPETLRRMKRPANVDRTRRLIADLRAAMPDVALRTAFIVGYPGETEDEFQTLLDFVAEARFDRVGGFLYSPEEGTAAAALPYRVPEEVQVDRLERLMALQQEISFELNQAQVGRTLEVLVEGQGEGLSVGRSYRDAPEIDGLVLIEEEIPEGQMVRASITGAMEYDLVGELL